jgi:hypothetical protein
MITIKSKKKEAAVRLRKKITAPHTRRGVKGGCSPQNNRRKPFRLLNELPAGGNKILYENFYHPSTGVPPRQKSDEIRTRNDKVTLAKPLAPCEIAARSGCTSTRRGF